MIGSSFFLLESFGISIFSLIPAAEEGLDESAVSESGTPTPEHGGSTVSPGLHASRVLTFANKSVNHDPHALLSMNLLIPVAVFIVSAAFVHFAMTFLNFVSGVEC